MWGTCVGRLFLLAALGSVAAAAMAPAPAEAQLTTLSEAEGVHAGELAVPVGKSQVIRSDRPFAKALIGNPDVADVLPLTDRSLYVLGKKPGTTSLTLYDRRSNLIAVVDVAVGPDVMGLKRQLEVLEVQGGVTKWSLRSLVAPSGQTASCQAGGDLLL